MSRLSQTLRRDVVKVIEKIKRQLKEDGQIYTAIYIFGSHARGCATKHSDIDLCVVIPTRRFNATKDIEFKVRFSINSLQFNTDVIVVSERDFKHNRLSPILHEIRKHNICVA